MKANMHQLSSVLRSPARLLILIACVASPCGGQEADHPSDRLPDIWTAAKEGDLKEIHAALASGAKISAQDDAHGITPLSWAAMSGHKDVVVAMVEAGADVNARNSDGATPLIAAAFFGRSEVVKTLLKLGARVDVTNNEGESPLDVMEVHRNTTHAKARALGVEVDTYQFRRGRKASSAILREHGAIIEERGSPLAFAVIVVIGAGVCVVAWFLYRPGKSGDQFNPSN